MTPFPRPSRQGDWRPPSQRSPLEDKNVLMPVPGRLLQTDEANRGIALDQPDEPGRLADTETIVLAGIGHVAESRGEVLIEGRLPIGRRHELTDVALTKIVLASMRRHDEDAVRGQCPDEPG